MVLDYLDKTQNDTLISLSKKLVTLLCLTKGQPLQIRTIHLIK